MDKEIDLSSPLRDCLIALNIGLDDVIWLAQHPEVTHQQQCLLPEEKALSLTEAVNLFLSKMENPTTRKNYCETLYKFNEFMTKEMRLEDGFFCTISDIKKIHIQTFLKTVCVNRSNATYNVRLSYLKAFFHGFLEANGYLTSAPTNQINTKVIGEAPIRYLTKSQQEAVLEKALSNSKSGPRDYLIVYLGLHTGMRVMELAALNVEDIMISEQRINIKNGKGKKHRLSAVNSVGLEIIEHYLEKVRKCFFPEKLDKQPLFLESKSGGQLERLSRDSMGKVIQRIFRACGIYKGCTHRLRHSFSMNLLEQGYSLPEIQRLLGHKNIHTTLTYLNVDNEKILNKLSNDYPLAHLTISKAIEHNVIRGNLQ